MTFPPRAVATTAAAPGNGTCRANHLHGFPGEFTTESVERAFRREKAAAENSGVG